MNEERQIELEAESVAQGKARYWKEVEKHGLSESLPGQRLIKAAVEPLAKAIRTFLDNATSGRAGRRHSVAKYLLLVEPEAAAWITAHTVFADPRSGDILVRVARHVGNSIKEHIEWTSFAETNRDLARFIERRLEKSTSGRHRKAVIGSTLKRNSAKLEWREEDQIRLGTTLIEMMRTSTGLIEIATVRERGRKQDRVRLTPDTEQKVVAMHGRCELLAPVHLPMVTLPKPWSNPYNGGYLTRRMAMVKTRNQNYMEELRSVHMPDVYAALNAMQQTAWRINVGVLNAMREVWESGGQLGDLPPRENLPLPAKPRNIATNEEARKKWKRLAARVHEENARLSSKRLAVARKLQIAQRFVGEPALYFPHVLDWRGRAYPVPADVNPQGDDSGRALLQFAEGKPLGETGAYWLAVHIANCFGVDKVAFAERVQWVENNSDKLIDSAMKPLDGERFWTTADKPWQALAACFEWMGFAMQGTEYVSRLPIALDGSCNGLQNFSAMLRDEVGGLATNLVPSEKPQDIYQRVADVVMAKLNQMLDHPETGEDRLRLASLWLRLGITRKLVKRPVMTLPYGVTHYGMRDQLLLEARDQGLPLGDLKFEACIFLSELVYEAIGEVVVAARKAMDWLQEAAKVAASNGLPVHWTAPQGFPVFQDYRSLRSRQLEVLVNGRCMKPRIGEETEKMDVRRQMLGISPNFVHSCDAAHLMRTVRLCVDAGIEEFGMIHDSYATLAADVEALNVILRQAFIEQYSSDVLGKFRQELVAQLPPDLAAKVPPLPEMGTLDVSGVLGSDYFFA